MSDPSIYRENHPRWLRQPVSTYWWLGRWPYVRFILREASSVFVAWFVIYLLIMVSMVKEGAAGYQRFLAFSAHPVVLTVNVITFFFIVFHAITWFVAAPQAIVAHLGHKRVPPALIGGSHYGAWLVVSAAIFWLFLH